VSIKASTIALAVCLLCQAPAFAQQNSDAHDREGASDLLSTDQPRVETPPPSLTGEWGGLRTKLRDEGVDLGVNYVSETAWNPAGGQREKIRETGQFTFATTIDTEKLVGLKGGKFQATVTFRRGKDLGAAADLGVLQQVQEVYGRGQTWRLTQFWYQQTFAQGHADIKLGRLTQGEDFAAFSCLFENLSFCGSPPGNLAGDYWYNWPISQWAVRARFKTDKYYAMIGAYEINPHNLDKTFTIGHFKGATGVMVPVEVGYTPRLGSARLPGAYRIGGWYNTADADDVKLDINRQEQAVTGLAPLRRDGRYGFFFQAQQQLTGTAQDTPSGPQTIRGLVAFLNVTQTDRTTSVTDNQIAGGLLYTGLIAGRPSDSAEFGVARTNVNARSIKTLAPGAEQPDAEYAAELAYRFQATGWLNIRPNVQYIVDPGGYAHADDVVILGVKAGVTF
jgi:porin